MAITAQRTIQTVHIVEVHVCMHIVNLQPLTTESCHVLIAIPEVGLNAAGCDV